ncbi:MAG: DUF4163 domain-containing protein [Lachnospiraceae bacterium]|nr:DUF4163 domain-containing protein [Lachnospiraceae bacterium]
MKRKVLGLLMALVLCVGLAACTDAKGKESEESKVSQEQTQAGSETGNPSQQGGETVTPAPVYSPVVTLFQDSNFGTYYALNTNGDKVAEYDWGEIFNNLKESGATDVSFATIYAAGDGALFTYCYQVNNDIWTYHAYAIDPKENKMVELMNADEGWWFDGMDYYNGKVYVTAVTEGYQRKEYVFSKKPNSFAFTQEENKYDGVIKGMEGSYVTLYSALVGRSYGTCSITRVLEECGFVIGNKDGKHYRFKMDGTIEVIPGLDKDYLNICGYDAYGMVYYTEDESGLYGLYVKDLKTGETKAVYPGSDDFMYLGYEDAMVYYAALSDGFVYKTNAVWQYNLRTQKSEKLYEKTTIPGASEVTPGTYLFRVLSGKMYFVDVVGDRLEWVRAIKDGGTVRFENTGMLVAEKNVFRYGTVIYDTFESKCPYCGIYLDKYYGEAFQLDPSYSKMADQINKVLKEDLDSTIKNYKENRRELTDEYCEEHLEMPYVYCETVEDEVNNVRIFGDRYLAVDYNSYWYGGGAHGMPFMGQYLFDLTTGDRLYLKDFYTGSERDFKNLVANKTREDFLSYGDDEYGTPYFATDARSLFNEAYENAGIEKSHVEFSEEGIYVIYDPYEMGPFASGFIEIFISYEELLGRPNL